MSNGLAEGYRLALPAGWVRPNVRSEVEETIHDALDDVLADVTARDDRARRRAAIEGRLRAAIAAAHDVDAHAIYLPLGGMHGMSVPMSFVIAEAFDASGEGPASEVLAALARGPGAAAARVDGVSAIRTDVTAEGGAADSGSPPAPTRQISYVVPVPGARRWLTIVCDIVTAGDSQAEFVEALVSLFDAVITTFRWT